MRKTRSLYLPIRVPWSHRSARLGDDLQARSAQRLQDLTDSGWFLTPCHPGLKILDNGIFQGIFSAL